MNERTIEAAVDPRFPERWSPRAFTDEPLTEAQVKSLLEAARWAPSCFNEQPWVFFYALEPAERERFCAALSERNRMWACRAPLLLFVASRTTFTHNGKPNRHAGFDAGAAWMSLALQARAMGLFAHAMAGFDVAKARAILNLPEETHDLLAAIAVGHRGELETLPETFHKGERPSSRKPLAKIGFRASSSGGPIGV